jgi:hypothetical protein
LQGFWRRDEEKTLTLGGGPQAMIQTDEGLAARLPLDPHECMFRRDDVDDRRLVEGDKVKIAGVPTGKGPCMLHTVAAEMPKRRVAWEPKQQSHQMCQKRLLRFLGVA